MSNIVGEHYKMNYISTNLPSYFTGHGHETEQIIDTCYSPTIKYRRNIGYITGITTINKEHQFGFLNNMTFLGTSTAIVYIALDTRLGCLDTNLAPDSEPQKMIDSVRVQFESFHKLEFGIPIWKYVSSPAWRKFVKAADVFVECV
jgi:hypothetical protein